MIIYFFILILGEEIYFLSTFYFSFILFSSEWNKFHSSASCGLE